MFIAFLPIIASMMASGGATAAAAGAGAAGTAAVTGGIMASFKDTLGKEAATQLAGKMFNKEKRQWEVVEQPPVNIDVPSGVQQFGTPLSGSGRGASLMNDPIMRAMLSGGGRAAA